VFIPIAQTQSIAQGISQFFWGTVGSIATGQAAYHGTKLLGGSEETAQLMNLLGNFVGGYAASKAASKFSLNKVKNNVSEPNFANYKEFLTKKIDEFKTNLKDVETKITVETRNAAGKIQRIQLKTVGVDGTGKIRIQDYTTAKDGLSIKRQGIHENLSKYGGTVVGEGKGRFVGGTKIERGTRIDVISKQTDNFTIDKVSSFDKVKQYTSELYKTDLSLEEKVQKLQKYFTELDDKVDINVPSDVQYVKSFEDGWNKPRCVAGTASISRRFRVSGMPLPRRAWYPERDTFRWRHIKWIKVPCPPLVHPVSCSLRGQIVGSRHLADRVELFDNLQRDPLLEVFTVLGCRRNADLTSPVRSNLFFSTAHETRGTPFR